MRRLHITGSFFVPGNFDLSIIQATTSVLNISPQFCTVVFYIHHRDSELPVTVIVCVASRFLGRRFTLNQSQVCLEGKEKVFSRTGFFREIQDHCTLQPVSLSSGVPRPQPLYLPRQAGRCPTVVGIRVLGASEYVTLGGRRDSADAVVLWTLGRLSWIVWVGTIQSHEPLQAQNFIGLEQKPSNWRASQRESRCAKDSPLSLKMKGAT